MKNLFIALSLCIAFVSNAQNQQSLLWEVSGNGLEKPSYIFGTIHMIPKADYFFTEVMQDAFTKSETLVIEADMFTLNLNEKIELAMQMILPNGETIEQYMDSVEYAELVQYLNDSLGVKPKTFEKRYTKIKPVFLASALVPEVFGKIKSYEEELYKKSKKQDKNFSALETVAFQMAMLQDMPLDEQVAGLEEIKNFNQFDELLALYKKQDLDGLYRMSMSEFETQEEQDYMDVFVNQRNADWIPKIDFLTRQNSCFIAVGALHLPGEKGVLTLLEKEGYNIRALK